MLRVKITMFVATSRFRFIPFLLHPASATPRMAFPAFRTRGLAKSAGNCFLQRSETTCFLEGGNTACECRMGE